MEKPGRHQNLFAKLQALDWRHILINVGGVALFLTIIVLTISLPVELIPSIEDQDQGQEPNVPDGNKPPSSCPVYTNVANGEGTPLSNGPLKLPFQRPQESCRTFTSPAMETLIANITSRMVDKDLARVFENAYPNTLGSSWIECAHYRYYGLLVQS